MTDFLSRGAQRVRKSPALPKYYPVGAHKAFREFQSFYGNLEGRRIFVQKALEQGQGSTIHDRVASVYKTGAKLDKGGTGIHHE